MKIIQALKELPLIEKKIQKNIELIKKYAAAVDNGKVQLFFDTVDAQRQQITSLIQSNNDLVSLKAKIRRDLATTNARTPVTINGKTYTIAEWIELKQHGLENMRNTFAALDDLQATRAAMTAPPNPTTGVKVVRFYDEVFKNSQLSEVLELQNTIDTILEIVNATTDIIE